MAEACGRVTRDILIACDNPLMGGANDRLILLNKDEIDNIVYDGTNPQVVTDLTLSSPGAGVVVEGKNNSVEPRSALVKLRYAEVYEHEVIFKVFANTPDVKEEIEQMARGRMVAVIENNHKGDGGNGAFEIYGLGSGLELAELERVVADTETQGAYNLVLRSSENSRESHLPNAFFDTDYATTKAKVDALY